MVCVAVDCQQATGDKRLPGVRGIEIEARRVSVDLQRSARARSGLEDPLPIEVTALALLD